MTAKNHHLSATLGAAHGAARSLRRTPRGPRATWLRALASALGSCRSELIKLAHSETLLPINRLEAEFTRTTFQLRFFADVVEDGAYLDFRHDVADPDWPMGPRPDLRRVNIPIGPVLVFAAGNFPFAFSVLGGDTTSALAAGCPVVVKAHPDHPKLAREVAELAAVTLREADAPEGTFALIEGVGPGVDALRDNRIRAAAFTGSTAGGRALFDVAASRSDPIPFFGELGSINPVVLAPAVARRDADTFVSGLISSFTAGAGQLCTKPGLVFAPLGADIGRRVSASLPASELPLLSEHGATAFVANWSSVTGSDDAVVENGREVRPVTATVSAPEFLEDPDRYQTECFGPATVVVEYDDTDRLLAALAVLHGSLTATVHADEADQDWVRPVVAELERVAGRLVWNDWPTGVSVTHAQQHGGVYPASVPANATSVGSAAITRFVRPIAYQGFPEQLLEAELR